MQTFFSNINVTVADQVILTLEAEGYTKEDLASIIATMNVNDLKQFGLTEKESRLISDITMDVDVKQDGILSYPI